MYDSRSLTILLLYAKLFIITMTHSFVIKSDFNILYLYTGILYDTIIKLSFKF